MPAHMLLLYVTLLASRYKTVNSDSSQTTPIGFRVATAGNNSILCYVGAPYTTLNLDPPGDAPGTACVPAVARCSWQCAQDAACGGFNVVAATEGAGEGGVCELFQAPTSSFCVVGGSNCQLFQCMETTPPCFNVTTSGQSTFTCRTYNKDHRTRTGPSISQRKMALHEPLGQQLIDSVHCSFPFTYGGQLYYHCAYDPSIHSCFKFCFLQNRILVLCAPSADYQAQNTTVSMTITTGPPVPVRMVNGWIQIQEKRDATYSFYKPWVEFQNGFGALDTAYYWIGLDRIQTLTAGANFKLRVELQENVTGLWYSVEYLYFQIDNAAALYTIHLSGYSGDITDAFLDPNPKKNINGMKFTTYDNDNDNSPTSPTTAGNCAYAVASGHGGGWWYNDCGWGEPNGAQNFFRWRTMTLQTSRMMVKMVEP